MIIGVVNELSEARVRLNLYGPTGARREVLALVDTGYSGALMVPETLIAELGLLKRAAGRATLADGSQCRFETYGAIVEWEGSPRGVVVSAIGDDPLIGMKLLAGHRLTVEVEFGGKVQIELRQPL